MACTCTAALSAEIAPQGVTDPQVRGVVARYLQLRLFRACVPGERKMGVPLVEGRDLVVENHRVFIAHHRRLRQCTRSTAGLNDDFLESRTCSARTARWSCVA